MEDKDKLSAAMVGGNGGDRISVEAAEAQFSEWLEYLDIDFEDIEIENGPEAAKTLKNGLIRSIRRGRLEVGVDGDGFHVTQHLKIPIGSTAQIVYRDKLGNARLAVDKVKATYRNAQMMQFMSTLSGLPVPEFAKLKGADATALGRISTIFSMV